MSAPRNLEALSLYVDEQLRSLSQELHARFLPIFHVSESKDAALVADTFEWGVGSFVIPFRCNLFGLGLSLTGGTARAKVDVERDGVVETDYAIDLTSSNEGHVLFSHPLEFFPGSLLRFHTVTQANTAGGNKVNAFLRVD